VTNFRLAVNRPPQRDVPEGKEQTDWLDIVAWGTVAENCAQYLDKGALVGIEGRVQSRSWETQDGQRHYAVEINARDVRFLESKTEAERRRSGQEQPVASGSTAAEGEDIFGDD